MGNVEQHLFNTFVSRETKFKKLCKLMICIDLQGTEWVKTKNPHKSSLLHKNKLS